jgi:sugar O-acyltransferase (sialic acid O-acetyltransferase NeuD family)
LLDLPVLGGTAWLEQNSAAAVAVAAGYPASRWKIVRALERLGPREYPVLVHPRAWIGNHVTLGRGSVVLAGAAISTEVSVGAFVCLNKNCIAGHEAVIGDFATVSPGASLSGRVHVGDGCDIGANSVVVQGVRVGEWSVVGAGAVVPRDLPPNVTAVGVPVKVIKERPEGWHQ